MLNKVNLRKGLEKCYSLGELKIVCFELGVDFDVLSGDSKPTKSLELVEYLDRRGKIDALVEYCVRDRPSYDWGISTPDSRVTVNAPNNTAEKVMVQWQTEIGIRIMQAAVVWVSSGLPERPVQACGFFVEPRGYVVTVDFVIDDPEHITIDWNKTKLHASLIARNKPAMTALLRVDGLADSLYPTLTMAATDNVSSADRIFLLGYNPGLGWLNNVGEVIDSVEGEYEIPVIRSQIETRPGYAGAPVMNERGHIVGIHFARDKQLGALMIPIEHALKLLTANI